MNCNVPFELPETSIEMLTCLFVPKMFPVICASQSTNAKVNEVLQLFGKWKLTEKVKEILGVVRAEEIFYEAKI